ncbi:zf-CCHC domain-containing protein [Tanacetum coccineum]
MAIEESKDLSSLALDELIAKKESSDDENLISGSNDEEYAMAVRNFRKFFRMKGRFVRQPRKEKSFHQKDDKKSKSDTKCFRCGDLNHLIGESLSLYGTRNKKYLLGVLGVIAKNEAKDKTNE